MPTVFFPFSLQVKDLNTELGKILILLPSYLA